MKKLSLFAVTLVLVLMVGLIVSPAVCHAEETAQTEQTTETDEKINADKIADIVIEKLNEQEKTKTLGEWLEKNRVEVIAILTALFAFAGTLISSAAKAKVQKNILNQEGVFKRTSEAIEANEKAVDKLNGYQKTFDGIENEFAALVQSINGSDENVQKQNAELKALLLACINMLHTAYAHSNLTEETKSVIEGFYGDAIHYNQKLAAMKDTLESLAAKFEELKGKMDEAKQQSAEIKITEPKKSTEWEG